LLTAILLTPGGSNTVQYTFTHKKYTEQNNETEHGTYITIIIHKYDKYTRT